MAHTKSNGNTRWLTWLGILGAFMLVALFAAHALVAPPLRVREDSHAVTIDVQTLGEYPTTVNHIRLTNADRSRVIWDVRAKKGDTQIRQLILQEGINPALIPTVTGSYEVMIPAGADGFTLQGGTRYYLELWTDSSHLSKQTASFRFSE